ncbi:MAG: thiamine biosynthesis protein ThiC [Gammaproteobacteria bacterium]|nr:thiamine biosynthesis protein ThiC [Gammaproteobacteria bacterium]
MEFSQKQSLRILAALLLLTVFTQMVYTTLYMVAHDVPRQWVWGLEALIFIFLTAFSGSSLAKIKNYSLGFAAIFASALLNVVQVGIGITQFGPFFEAAKSVESLAPVAGSVLALSFFVYNAAKVLLGLSAVAFGLTVAKQGANLLGKLTAMIGLMAVVTNTIVMMFGRIEAVPSGVTGVIATLLLAVCLLKLEADD